MPIRALGDVLGGEDWSKGAIRFIGGDRCQPVHRCRVFMRGPEASPNLGWRENAIARIDWREIYLVP